MSAYQSSLSTMYRIANNGPINNPTNCAGNPKSYTPHVNPKHTSQSHKIQSWQMDEPLCEQQRQQCTNSISNHNRLVFRVLKLNTIHFQLFLGMQFSPFQQVLPKLHQSPFPFPQPVPQRPYLHVNTHHPHLSPRTESARLSQLHRMSRRQARASRDSVQRSNQCTRVTRAGRHLTDHPAPDPRVMTGCVSV